MQNSYSRNGSIWRGKNRNAGTITVNEGVGMLLGVGATFSNTGNIFVKNGIGIEGPGTLTILEILLFYLVEWGQQLL